MMATGERASSLFTNVASALRLIWSEEKLGLHSLAFPRLSPGQNITQPLPEFLSVAADLSVSL